MTGESWKSTFNERLKESRKVLVLLLMHWVSSSEEYSSL